jgi:tetratricopeptide (TPR) repeat protein
MSTVSRFQTNCAVFALFAVSGFAQIITTTINGAVTAKDGKPAVGAEIRFTRTDMKSEYKLKVGKDGKYTYPTLPMGKYDVTILVDGAEAFKTTNIATNPAKAFELNVDLSKAVGAQMSGTATMAGPPAGARPDDQAAAKQAEAAAKAAAAAQAAAQAEYDKAKKAQDDKQTAVQGFFTAGMTAYAAKDWNGAIDNLTKASAVDVKVDVVWANLADAYAQRAASLRGAARLPDYQKAEENWVKAIEIKPLNASYHNNYGNALAGSGKLDQAKDEFDQAAKLDPTQAGMYYRNLGSSYFDAGKNDLAEATYKQAIAAEPNNPEGYYRLGLSLIARATGPGADGKMVAPAGTTDAFQKYLELAPTGANADEAKGMLEALGATVATGYKNPNAPAPTPAKGKAKGK